MSDLTREQIESCLTTFPDEPDWFSAMDEDAQEAFVRNVFVMALRALDAGWQPMSTAPRDGTRVLVSVRSPHWTRAEVRLFHRGDWLLDAERAVKASGEMLAWMPLPLPPPPCAEVPHE